MTAVLAEARHNMRFCSELRPGFGALTDENHRAPLRRDAHVPLAAAALVSYPEPTLDVQQSEKGDDDYDATTPTCSTRINIAVPISPVLREKPLHLYTHPKDCWNERYQVDLERSCRFRSWQLFRLLSRRSKKVPLFFKFAVVRNPWDRLCSAFYFLQHDTIGRSDVRWYLRQYETLDDFIRSGFYPDLRFYHVALRPQKSFIFNAQREIMMDYVGRFEALEESMQVVAHNLQINRPLPNLNRGDTRDYREEYKSTESVDFVYQLYRDDIDTFGYTFE